MEIEIINQKVFEEKTKSGVVVVDFFATWCGPCRMMSPILEEAKEELEEVKFFKVDVDQDESLARSFGVMSIPTIVILKNGKEVDKHIGLWQKDQLVEAVSRYL